MFVTCAASRAAVSSIEPPTFGLAARTSLRDLSQKAWRHACEMIGSDWKRHGPVLDAELYEEVNWVSMEERLLEAATRAGGGCARLGTLEEYAAVNCWLRDQRQTKSWAGGATLPDLSFVSQQRTAAIREGRRAQVQTMYKPVGRKVRPAAEPLPPDAEERVARARKEPRLRDPAGIGHQFTPETLAKIKIGDGNLSREEEDEIRQVLLEHQRAFAFDETEIGCVDPQIVPPMILFTVEHLPWKLRPLPVPRAHYSQLLELLQRRIRNRVLEPGYGPYASRWFTVPKKDGRLRFIQDLQPANRVIIRNTSIVPIIDDYIDEFAGRAVYSLVDLFSGYDQFQLEVASRDLTAIQTPLGLLRMTTAPMGCTNSVGHAVTGVNEVFRPFIPRAMIPFIDDLPVRGCATEDRDDTEVRPGVRRFIAAHIDDLRGILGCALGAGITFSGLKGAFAVPEIGLVGYYCNAEGKRVDAAKLPALERMGPCRSVTEVRRFLGGVGFYRVFIPRFAETAEPLYSLLRKRAEWSWTEECTEAMDCLRDALRTAPVLRPLRYGPGRGTIFLTVDAGPCAAGWVLSQDDADGERHPARFGAKTFGPTQRVYPQTKKELLAARLALREERYRILGATLVLETDCRALLGMIQNCTTVDVASCRWLAEIKEYDIIVRHIGGTANVVADWLSRARYAEDGEDGLTELPEVDGASEHGVIVGATQVGDKTSERVAEAEGAVSTHSKEDNAYTRGGPNATPLNSIRPINGSTESSNERSTEQSTGAETAGPLERQVLEYLTAAQEGRAMEAPRNVRRRSADYFVAEGYLWRRPRPGYDEWPRRVLLEVADQEEALRALHSSPTAGHRGFDRTYRRLRDRYTWTGMRRDTERFVQACPTCQIFSKQRHHDELHPVYPRALLFYWSVDLVTMPRAARFRDIVLAREELTNFVEGRALRSNRTGAVCRFLLEEIMARYGCPARVRADRGELDAKEAVDFFKRQGIQLSLTTSYNPEANGKIERGHQPIIAALAKAAKGRVRAWPALLPYALWADRTTTHRTTGFAPADLMYGQRVQVPTDALLPTWGVIPWADGVSREQLLELRIRHLERREEDLAAALAAAARAKDRMKEEADRHRRRPHPVHVGDWVLVRREDIEHHFRAERKFQRRWNGPFVVVAIDTATSTYTVRELDGTVLQQRYPGKRIKFFHRDGATEEGLGFIEESGDEGADDADSHSDSEAAVTFFGGVSARR